MGTVHKESQETKDFIVDWIDPKFFYSKKDVWHRFGFLGVFGDYVLSCTPGDISEVGVGESSIYLGYLARKWNRKAYHCDIARGKIVNPLTVAGYLTEEAVFPEDKQEVIEHKNSLFYIGASNDFYTKIDPLNLAFSFIDGDHRYEQARQDFFNTAERTVDNGYIVLHDTHPPELDYLREERCGDVYRLRQEIEMNPRFDCITLPVGCAVNVGFTIVRKKPRKAPYYNE